MAKQLLRSAGPIEGGVFVRRLILSLSILIAAPAQAEWLVATSKHFVIFANDKPANLQKFATRLEQFDLAVRAVRNMPDDPIAPSARPVVFVVQSSDVVQDLAKDRSGMVQGFYVPRSSGPIAVVPAHAETGERSFTGNTVFFHEYAHHLMFENIKQAVPSWFVEGFAEFFATAKFERDGITIGISPAYRSYGIFTQAGISLQQLLATNYAGRLDGAEMESLYGRGWLLCHYLTFAPNRKGQLVDYLSRLAKGQTGITAAEGAFGDLKQLEREMDRYIVRSQLPSMGVKFPATAIGRVDVRRLTAGEAAIISLRRQSRVGVDERTAAAVLARVRPIASSYPNDALVALELAEASLDAKDYAGGESAAARAKQLNPKSVEALLLHGRILLVQAERTRDKSMIARAREDFLAANRLEPEHPEPLRAYYESFATTGQAPTANAVEGLHYAAVLAPADRGLRWMSAQQYLINGKAADARKRLAPLAFDPHGGELSERTRKVIDLIDAGKPKEALSEFRAKSQHQEEKKKGD
jgi:hypothetical protein